MQYNNVLHVGGVNDMKSQLVEHACEELDILERERES